MKVLFIGVARSMWVFDLNLLNPKGLSWQGVFVGVKERYKFAKAPQHLLDLNEEKNLGFQVGTFVNSKKVPINVSFNVYNNGFTAETQSSTDDATEFLKDLAAWLAKEHGFILPPDSHLKKGYFSQMEVECDTPLVALNPKLTTLLRAIDGRVKTLDGKQRQFELGAIHCWTEDVNQPMFPAIFRFERKWGVPFAKNQYFTQSALETQAHIEILDELERIVRS